MIQGSFQPSRLRLARELVGLTQTGLAREVGVSAAAVSQFEAGTTNPTFTTIESFAGALGVPTGFFSKTMSETHDGFFRSLRRSTVTDRRKARAVAHLVHDIAIEMGGELPQLDVPHFLISDLDASSAEPADIARRVREQWSLPRGPAGNIVELLEAHGILVVRLPLGSADVDAFSLPFEDRPVIVLGSDKNDRARSRFDAAHELGHLVMHGEQMWGVKEVENQAHQFAAEFLMPEQDIAELLPTRVDWPTMFRLKKQWQVSLAALLKRAKDLNRMQDPVYLTAVKAASARGWRRAEPVPLGDPELPCRTHRLIVKSRDSELMDPWLPRSVLEGVVAATSR